MPNTSWWPNFELSLIFRHTVVSIAVAVAVWIVSQAVLRFVPQATKVAELIDELVLLGVLSLLGLELILVLIVGLMGMIGSIWKMISMRLSPLNYRSLFLLYGISAIVLLPFGGAYAYASTHGWNHGHALFVCLILGVAVALLVWTKLEPRLLAAQPAEVNLKVAMPQIFSGLPIPQIAAVGVFVAAITCAPAPFRKGAITATSAASFRIVVATQSTSDQAADQTAAGAGQNVIRT